MKHSPLPRKASLISDSLHRQLNMYALAAAATGAGALATSSPAEAKIVYTPANIGIAQNGGLIKFDLNHDGIKDFGLSNTFRTSSSKWFTALAVKPLKSANQISAKDKTGRPQNPYPVAKGTKIGSQAEFHPDYPLGGLMASTDIGGYHSGYWANQTAYLGLKFVIKGKTHYGWARVQVILRHTKPYGYEATLKGYAYETVPNTPIIAGATMASEETAGSPGALAAGAAER